MKLVQLLAKELKEWPEGVVRAWQSGCDNEIYFDGANSEMFYTTQHADDSGYSGSRITRKQWQAEREKMNKPKWIRHRGGKCPVKAGTKVVTRYRDGLVSDWCMTRNQDTDEECLSAVWSHSGDETDIMAYYVEETKDQEIEEVTPKHMAFGYASKEEMVAQIVEECPFSQVASAAEKTNFGTITYKLEIDATEATKEIDSLVAKWGQIESPLKWRDEIIELEAYEEEFRREREKLILKLESEGFKLIDHAATVYGDQIIDLSDWRNWQAGDIVECVTDDYAGVYTNGKHYVVELVKEDVFSVFDDCGKGSSCDWFDHESEGLKFIRRP